MPFFRVPSADRGVLRTLATSRHVAVLHLQAGHTVVSTAARSGVHPGYSVCTPAMSTLLPQLWLIPSSGRISDWFVKPRQPVMSATQQPSNQFLLEYVTAMCMIALFGIIVFKRLHHRDRHEMVQACGVSVRKVARSVREIKRKGFHIAGLLVPLVQLILLRVGYTNADCVRLCWTITIVGTSCDYMRLRSPLVARYWPMRSILREHEHRQLTGGCYFACGCTLAICARPHPPRALPCDPPRP